MNHTLGMKTRAQSHHTNHRQECSNKAAKKVGRYKVKSTAFTRDSAAHILSLLWSVLDMKRGVEKNNRSWVVPEPRHQRQPWQPALQEKSVITV